MPSDTLTHDRLDAFLATADGQRAVELSREFRAILIRADMLKHGVTVNGIGDTRDLEKTNRDLGAMFRDVKKLIDTERGLKIAALRANGEIALMLAHTWGEVSKDGVNTSVEPLTEREKALVATALGWAGWIDVKDRLPALGERVLVLTDMGNVCDADYGVPSWNKSLPRPPDPATSDAPPAT